MMCIILFFFLFIYMLNSIIGVEMFDVVGSDGISGLPSSFGWGVSRHEGRGEAKVSVFGSIGIDECSVDYLVCCCCRFIQDAR